jgi:hypothetical protein
MILFGTLDVICEKISSYDANVSYVIPVTSPREDRDRTLFASGLKAELKP